MFTSQRLTGLPAIDSAPAAALVLRLVILFRTRSCSSGGGYGTARAWEKRFPLEDEKGHSSKSRLKCRPDDLRMSDKACQDRMKVEGSLAVLLCLSEGETREKSRIKCWSRRLIWSSVTLRLIFTRTGRKIRLSVLECFILFGSWRPFFVVHSHETLNIANVFWYVNWMRLKVSAGFEMKTRV